MVHLDLLARVILRDGYILCLDPTLFGMEMLILVRIYSALFFRLSSCLFMPGLVTYGFVTEMFVDGYSRLVTGIRVATNNRASMVLSVFLEGVSAYGVPSRVRGDHGSENLRVAAWMIQHRGDRRGSYIFGRSKQPLFDT